MNASLGAFAAVSSLTLHRAGFDEIPGGTINLDFIPDLSKAEINLTGSFEIHDTPAAYQIITRNGNTNGKTITEDGSATIKWSNAGTDADGDNVDVILHVTNFTHSGNSEKACIMRYFKATKTLWNGASALEDSDITLHWTSVDISMEILKHGTKKSASGTYLLAFVDIDQPGEKVKILDGTNDVYVQSDCTCEITENNTLFTSTSGDENTLRSGFIAITNTTPAWRMYAAHSAATSIFTHFDQYDFVATTTDGGTITNVGTKKVNWHSGITYKMTPKAGYHMKKLTVDGKVVPNASTYSFTMATARHTIDVEWEGNSYNIAYDKNGGTRSMPNQIMTYGVEKNLSKNAFARSGYTFTGWKMGDKDNGTFYHDEDIVKNLTDVDGGTVTMYAQWIKNGYFIKYDRNGGTGSMPDQTMQYDVPAKLTKNAFTREGYSFTGWRLGDASSGIEYQDEQNVTNLTESDNGSVTMYAQWSPISYTIAFDKNRADATGTTSSMSMKFDVAKNLTANGFSSASSKFAGWNTKADGTGAAYKDGQNVKNLTSTDGATVTLYAIWSTNTYTVSFVDGHDGTTITTARIPYGGNATPPTKPYHDGYTPTSWDGDYTNITSDRTITLNYRPNTYRIAFKSNGGTGSMPNQNMEYDKESALSPNLFTKTGYTFSGWRLDNKDAGTKYSDRQKVVNLTAVDGGVVTMYAQWVPNGYTVKYNSNGGTGTMPNQSMTYDVSSKLDANRFTRSGYTWIGWRRDNAASGKAYRNRQEVVNLLSANGGATTMYAQWSPNSYTVTFIDGHDGKTIGTETVAYGSNATEPNKPAHEGYTATTWNKPLSNITGDTVITLAYRPNAYVIRFDKNADNATGFTADKRMEYDKAGNLTRNGYSRAGYTWLGWSSSSDSNGTMYSDEQNVVNLTSEDGGTVTLYAVWKINHYTVTFIDGKTGDAIGRQEIDYGGNAVMPSAPSHTGYKPNGWNSNGKNITKDATITLSYQPISYQIAFDKNSGEANGTMPNQRMQYDQWENLDRNAFSRPGYRFAGWDTHRGSGTSYEDGERVRNLSETDGDIITLYARWIEDDHVSITYKVESDDGKGENEIDNAYDDMNPTTGTPMGSTATASKEYDFIGWYDSDGKLVSPDAKFVPSKPAAGKWVAASYTAKFKRKAFTVSFVGKDGGELKEEKVPYGDPATAPDAPVIDGYEFAGWDTSFDSVTSDLTVTAVYRELPKPAPQPEQPAPVQPAPQPEQKDETVDDLIQTGVDIAPAIAVPVVIATLIAFSIARRKRK